MIKRLLGIGILAGAITIGVAGAWAVNRDDSAQAEQIEFRAGGAAVRLATPSEAVDELSATVGFGVVEPTTLPDSLTLAMVDSAQGPPDVSNAMKVAILSYGSKDVSKRGTYEVRIEETGVRIGAPTDRAVRIELGVPGVEAYTQVTPRATGYWVLTESRGFVITSTGTGGPSESELVEMVTSLVKR